MSLRFTIDASSSASEARVGLVETPHGCFETPAFMPLGTRGSVKGILPRLVRETGSQIILNNTYHLLLRPGPNLIEQLGGVHRFMGWNGPILTDSGGFQAFSMSDINRIDEDGVTFKSIVDGSDVRLSPAIAMHVQNQLGADIIMAFDDCAPADADAARLRIANERTVRWLEQCRREHSRLEDQSLFGIVQGGTDLDERTWSVERVCAVDLPGFAIGGVAVGETQDQIESVVTHTARLMPREKPRYLMGVGYDHDIVGAVLAGVDMFDCALPTRNGRNANAFTAAGQIRLRNSRFKEESGPIEEGCDCHACDPAANGWETIDARPFSRAYLRHLFIAGEMLGPILVSLHNIRYFQRLMADLRRTIRDDHWGVFARRWPHAATGIPSALQNGPERRPS